MKRGISALAVVWVTLSATFFQIACNKENSGDKLTSGIEGSSSETIGVAANASVANTDSVYIIQKCGPGGKRDSIAQSALPSAVGTYLDSNYSGYIFFRAYAINDGNNSVTGYVVVIYYNDKPVGLEFDAAGEFVKVLEQKDGNDHEGMGGHRGHHFPFRNTGIDSVSLTSLPAALNEYMSSNYPADTLVKAYINTDSSFVVLSKDNALFATVFTYVGTFVARMELTAPHDLNTNIDQSALPAVILTYLDTTYPGYTFKKAFSLSSGGQADGYMVFIDANNTKYAVAFDGSGNYVGVKTVR